MMDQWQYLDIAYVVAQSSTCSRLKVGAILVHDGRVISTGYNGAPAGLDHCEHIPQSKVPCSRAVHAEANTIAFAAKYGTPTDGSWCYTTHSPCENCAQLLINAGIIKVGYQIKYRITSGLDLLEEAGVETFAIG